MRKSLVLSLLALTASAAFAGDSAATPSFTASAGGDQRDAKRVNAATIARGGNQVVEEARVISLGESPTPLQLAFLPPDMLADLARNGAVNVRHHPLRYILTGDGGGTGGGGMRDDPCDGALYSNYGYDESSAYLNELHLLYGSDATVLDDFSVDNSANITSIAWQEIIDNYGASDPDTVAGMDASLWQPKLNGSPGKQLYDVQNTTYTRVNTGLFMFGTYAIYNNTTDISARVIGGQAYFINARPRVNDDFDSYWTTAPGEGLSAWYRFSKESAWSETSSGFSFCVLGEYATEQYGACCIEGETVCTTTLESECKEIGGGWYGDNSSCVPSPCANVPGACCVEGVPNCKISSPQDCEAEGGTFKGGEVSCSDGCPVPDVCGDAYYSQYGFDGVTYRTNNSHPYFTSWAVDDLVANDPLEVTAIVNQSIEMSFGDDPSDVTKYNYSIFADSGTSPGKVISSDSNLTTFYRMTDGSTFNGNAIFTNLVYLNSAARLFPATYFIGARPVVGSNGQSFIASSSSGNGRSGWWQYTFDGGAWHEQGGEFSFCVLGTASNAPFGACCTDGDKVCSIKTESECDGLGGIYYGDAVSCSPSPCSQAPGACCFLEPFGCFDGYLKADCDSEGGTFGGGDTTCKFTNCPLPQWCEDDGYYSQLGRDPFGFTTRNMRSTVDGEESTTLADDFIVSSSTEITGVVIEYLTYQQGHEVPDPPLAAVDWTIWRASDFDLPGQIVASAQDSTNFENILAYWINGQSPLWRLKINFDTPLRLAPGHYYVNGRPRVDAVWYAFIPTVANITNHQGVFLEDGHSIYWWELYNKDFSFCVLGQETDVKFGACCTDKDSVCTLLSSDECSNAGGSYNGDDSSCLPGPCGNVAGSCCLTFGNCELATKSQCDADGGTYQGGGIDCENTICPIPDWCNGDFGDVLYGNFAMNNVGGITSQDSHTIDWFESIAVDDVTFDSSVTITGLSWYDTTTDPGADFDGFGDFFVFADDAGGGPGTEVAHVEDLALIRLNTGEKLGSYPIYLNHLDANQTLSAGTYWVGARPNIVIFNRQTFTAFAPLSGLSEAYFRWTLDGNAWHRVSEAIGAEEDISLCLTGTLNPCSGVLLGDSDGSGSVNFNDINCFVAALISPGDWADCGTALPPGAFICANDTDHSGAVDFNDIDSFVDCLVNNSSPCP